MESKNLTKSVNKKLTNSRKHFRKKDLFTLCILLIAIISDNRVDGCRSSNVDEDRAPIYSHHVRKAIKN